MRRKKQSTLLYLPSVGHRGRIAVGDQSKEDLRRICDALNSTEKPELRDELRVLLKMWQASGPNLEKMMYSDLTLMKNVQLACRPHWKAQNNGRALLLLMPDYAGLERALGRDRVSEQQPDGRWTFKPEAEALVLFHLFTLNPDCTELAGPCPRCNKYYVKKRASQKVYCSRRCGNAATAVDRTRAKSKAEHKDKMRRAKSAIQRWNGLENRSTLDWKEWLNRHAASISPKFVTRWVNKKKLPRPNGTGSFTNKKRIRRK
jgi:hypothetical protein